MLILMSIPGIRPEFTAGVLFEFGSINAFDSNNALDKYSGFTWKTNQSGTYTSDELA